MEKRKRLFGHKPADDSGASPTAGSSVKVNKLNVIIIFGVLILFIAFGALTYFYISSRKSSKDAPKVELSALVKQQQADLTKVADTQKTAASSEPPINADAKAKEQHYTDALFYYLIAKDNKGASDYYVQKVLPSGVVITRLDLRENLAAAMINTGHNMELKKLINSIIVDYQVVRSQAKTPEAIGAVDKIINSYKQREASI